MKAVTKIKIILAFPEIIYLFICSLFNDAFSVTQTL
jgi:hypothetical protein